MIQLTMLDGTPVTVNPFHIFYIRPLGDAGSQIVSSEGAALEVVEAPATVSNAIKRWTRSGAE